MGFIAKSSDRSEILPQGVAEAALGEMSWHIFLDPLAEL